MPGSLHRQRSLGAASAAFPSAGTLPPNPADQWQEMAVLAEAHHLRLHQKRLEERGMVLEDQNRQLQMQLDRLQRLMKKVEEGEEGHGKAENGPKVAGDRDLRAMGSIENLEFDSRKMGTGPP